MNRENISIIKTFIPSFLLLFISFIQGVLTGSYNLIGFILVYSLVVYYYLFNEKLFNILSVVLSGIIMDSINGVSLGLSSFLFLITYALSKYESKYIKVKDFLTCLLFYAINITVIVIIILVISLFINTNFTKYLDFLIISLVLYPIIYNLEKLYKSMSSSHEK